MDYEKIGKFIAKLRRENNYTQEQLAEMLFVDRTTVSKLEQGLNNISTDMLLRLSNIFNITINEMIIGEKMSKNNIEKINDVTTSVIRKKSKLKRNLIIILTSHHKEDIERLADEIYRFDGGRVSLIK